MNIQGKPFVALKQLKLDSKKENFCHFGAKPI